MWMEGAVDQKQIVARLLAKANKYRHFALWLGEQSRRKLKSGSGRGKYGKKTTDLTGGM
jgi:hypothetical protein